MLNLDTYSIKQLRTEYSKLSGYKATRENLYKYDLKVISTIINYRGCLYKNLVVPYEIGAHCKLFWLMAIDYFQRKYKPVILEQNTENTPKLTRKEKKAIALKKAMNKRSLHGKTLKKSTYTNSEYKPSNGRSYFNGINKKTNGKSKISRKTDINTEVDKRSRLLSQYNKHLNYQVRLSSFAGSNIRYRIWLDLHDGISIEAGLLTRVNKSKRNDGLMYHLDVNEALLVGYNISIDKIEKQVENIYKQMFKPNKPKQRSLYFEYPDRYK